MQHLGDFALGQTIDVKFVTTEPDTGAPATLSGTPAISAYVGNSTTQITAGITLSVDFDGVTGLNNVRVVASGGNGYTADTDVSLVITTGTVDSVSAVGYVVGSFTLSRATTVLVDTEALLTDTEAVLTDAEAIIADTEAAITSRATILTDTEAVLADTEGSGAIASILTDAEALLVDTEAAISVRNAILADTEAATGVITDTEAILTDTEAAITSRATILTDTEALLVDTEATITDAEAILADTNELQTDDYPTTLAAILADTESAASASAVATALGAHTTTIATLASQTEFTLTAGSADDDAYVGFGCFVRDQSTSTQIELGIVDTYVGSTRTVTLKSDPAVFTKATGDTVILLPAKLDSMTDSLAAILTDTEAAVTDTESLLTGQSTITTDTEALLVDTEAIITDTEAAITSRATILTDTEALLVDTEAAAAVLTDTEAIIADTEAAITSRATILTDTEALLVDTEAAAAVLTDTEAILTDAEALRVGVNITHVNEIEITGDGESGTEFGPV